MRFLCISCFPSSPAVAGSTGIQLPSASTALGSATSGAAPAQSLGQPMAAQTGFRFGAVPSAAGLPSASSGFGGLAAPPTIPQAQTATGIPYPRLCPAALSMVCRYPKETKFADLPPDVKAAIESLESSIRKYESGSAQLASRTFQDLSSFSTCLKSLEKVAIACSNLSHGPLVEASELRGDAWPKPRQGWVCQAQHQ